MKEKRTFKIVSDFIGGVMYELPEEYDNNYGKAKAFFYEKFEEELRDLVEMYGSDDPVCKELPKLMYLVTTYPNGYECKTRYEGNLTPQDCYE